MFAVDLEKTFSRKHRAVSVTAGKLSATATVVTYLAQRKPILGMSSLEMSSDVCEIVWTIRRVTSSQGTIHVERNHCACSSDTLKTPTASHHLRKNYSDRRSH